MFDRNEALSRHIYEAAIKRRALEAKHAIDPLAHARKPDCEQLLKTNCFFSSYQMKHLKAVADEDAIYALPKEALPMLVDLAIVAGADVLAQPAAFGPDAGQRRMMEDVAEDDSLVIPTVRSPMVCFRLAHLKPKNRSQQI